MNTVFHELIGVCVLSYIDDILIYSPTLEQHQTDVERVLQLLQRHKLYIKEYERNIFNVPEEELNQFKQTEFYKKEVSALKSTNEIHKLAKKLLSEKKIKEAWIVLSTKY